MTQFSLPACYRSILAATSIWNHQSALHRRDSSYAKPVYLRMEVLVIGVIIALEKVRLPKSALQQPRSTCVCHLNPTRLARISISTGCNTSLCKQQTVPALWRLLNFLALAYAENLSVGQLYRPIYRRIISFTKVAMARPERAKWRPSHFEEWNRNASGLMHHCTTSFLHPWE